MSCRAGDVTAIVQARMGSTRLPGKVLAQVMGRPLLGYLVERLRRAECLREIVLATSTDPADEAVAEAAASLGVACHRGSLLDVLDRYTQAARLHDAQHVMRITADCPLLDPRICDRVADLYFTSGADHAATSPGFPEGLDCEVFSRAALEDAWENARLPSEREHVTLYFRNHRERFRLTSLDNESDQGGYRVTVDEPADLEVVAAVLRGLYPVHGPAFTRSDIVEFLDAHPDVKRTNASIVRNEGLLRSLEADRAALEKEHP